MLRDNLPENDLLGKILRAHDNWTLLRATGAPNCEGEEETRCDQTAENLCSTHPSPPSARRAMAAAGMAPARISVVSTDASPRKMKPPIPTPPAIIMATKTSHKCSSVKSRISRARPST